MSQAEIDEYNAEHERPIKINVAAEMEFRRNRKVTIAHQEWGRKLKELRGRCDGGNGITQPQAAKRSGIGVKTLSSFETGERIGAIKVVQLQKLCEAYGVTLAQFFAEVQ